MKKILAILFIALACNASAQKDSLNLLQPISKGKTSLLARYYYSSTDNAKNYTDYFANGIAAGIKYQSAFYKNFQLNTSAHFIYNIYSSNLKIPDALSGQVNRYEIGLFDVLHPDERKDLFKLEELNLLFKSKNISIKLGRQLPNTPFINQQDGRLRPTAIDAASIQYERKKIKFEASFIYGISPRSTAEWFSVGGSMGIYPQGVNQKGTAGNYFGNIKSKGIIVTSFQYKHSKQLQFQIWNQWVDNVFNTSLFQTDYSIPLKNTSQLIYGLQLINQFAINSGGNVDPLKTYFQKNQKAFVISSKTGWKNKEIETSLNFTRITKTGQYLMPREWGKDPFYTFMPRERNEGFGNVNAVVAKISYSKKESALKTEVAFGNFNLPDAKDALLNKYPMPSYQQLNIDLKYSMNKIVKGLEGQLLFVRKFSTGNTYNNGKFIINKVNMSIINLILNYRLN